MFKILSCAASAITVLTTIVLFWFSDKGLDLCDEGWYLLASQFPSENRTWFGACFYLTGMLLKVAGNNVVLFRWAGIIGLIASGLFLGRCVYRFIEKTELTRDRRSDALTCAAFCVIGSLMYYTWGLYSPGYNWLIAVFVNIFAGVAVLLFNVRFSKEEEISRYVGTAGVTVALAFLAKFSSGILLFVLFLLWLYKLGYGKYAFKFFMFVVLTCAGYFLLVQPLEEWIRTFMYGLSTSKLLAHDTVHLLKRYARSLRFFLADGNILALGFLTALTFVLRARSGFIIRKIYDLTVAVLLGCFVYVLIQKKFYIGGWGQILYIVQMYVACLLFVVTAVVGFLIFRPVSGDRERIVFDKVSILCGAALLLFLPLAASFGSANPLTAQCLFTMAPFFALLSILLFYLRRISGSAVFPSMIAIVVMGFAASQIMLAPIKAPYAGNPNILTQTVATSLGHPQSVLYLDPSLNKFIAELKAFANKAGFKAGDDILAFYDLPGVVFALGGKSPATGWWWGPSTKGYREAAQINLDVIPAQRLQRAFIISNVPDEFLPQLSNDNIRFPQDYELIGETFWDLRQQTVKFWKPIDRENRVQGLGDRVEDID